MINLHYPGTIRQSEMKNLAVIQGVQQVLPAELFDFFETRNRQFDLFQRSMDQAGPLATNMEIPAMLCTGQVFVIKEIEVKTSYHTPKGNAGSCSNCGAPWTELETCSYCGSLRPPLTAFEGSIHGNLELYILNSRFYSGKIPGPLTTIRLDPAVAIPSQTCFSLRVNLDRDVDSLLGTLRGTMMWLGSAF